MRPFLLRRLKAEVERGIPPKKELTVYCKLTPEQITTYKAILKKNREPNGALDFLSRFFGSKDRTACVTEERRTHKGGDGSSVEDFD